MNERTLQQFRGMEGPYGVLTVIAKDSTNVEFQLTSEWVRLTRDDAQEMIRVLSAWLAAPLDTQVVRTHGRGSEVHIVDDGPGAPTVSLSDDDGPRSHQGERHYPPTERDGEPRRRPS
jgi:hypothetical protein